MEVEVAGLKGTSTKNGNVIVSSDKLDVSTTMYKEEDFMLDNSGFIKYIKNIESQIRTCNEYSGYIAYLKNDLEPGLKHCMVYSDITDDMTSIEMHHGVIFTLFDYVEIVIGWHLKNGLKFSTPLIANIVMQEHLDNNVQVVMLCEAAHKSLHPKKKGIEPKFVDHRMCHGNIVNFLNKYYDGLNYNHLGKLRRYFDTYEENMKSQDTFFEEFITKWNNEIQVLIWR